MPFRRAFDPVRALGASWTLLMRAPLTLFAGGVLLFLTDGDNLAELHMSSGDLSASEALFAGVFGGVACCLAFGLFVFNGLLHIGFAGAVQRVMVTGEEHFVDLFRDRGLWLAMVIARVLKFTILVFGLLPLLFLVGGPLLVAGHFDVLPLGGVAALALGLAYLPIWFFVMLGLLLVELIVAVESKDPVAALHRSWEVARGRRLQLLLFWIVTGLVELSGIFACCVGVLFTSSWSKVAWFEAYLRFALPEPENGLWIDGRGTASVEDGDEPR